MSADIERWAEALRRAGHLTDGGRLAVLGSGMEGTVLDLGQGLVAKVWRRRTAAELDRFRTFYDALAAAGPALATPRILDVVELDGAWVTVEPRLDGRPLRASMGRDEPLPTDDEVGAMVALLQTLAAIPPDPLLAVLPVLEGEPPFRAGAEPFPQALAGLVERRAARFREPLRARLPDLDGLVGAVRRSLEVLGPVEETLVHGDLIPANILVDGAGSLVAVLDFGFLSTVGDPAFDAAVAASVHDMYGERAADTEAVIDTAVRDRFRHAPERLALYRAAYALSTANCFSASGSDGHFEWCARMLERRDVRDAIGL